MKKPIAYGLTALCVLSSPALVQDFKTPSFIKTYRSIASEVVGVSSNSSKLFDSSNPVESYEEFQNQILKDAQVVFKKSNRIDAIAKMSDLELAKISKDELKELKTFSQGKHSESIEIRSEIKKVHQKLIDLRKDESSIDTSTIEIEKLVEKVESLIQAKDKVDLINDITIKRLSLKEQPKVDSVVCGLKDQISSLSEQVAELLKDKEEALAKIEEKEKKKKARAEKLKKTQNLYAMGMIFGHGMRTSMAMPRMNFQTNPFMIYNPLASLSQGNFSWLNLMRSQFSNLSGMGSVGPTTQIVNNYLGESTTQNRDVAFSPRTNFIPSFSRSTVTEESISVN